MAGVRRNPKTLEPEASAERFFEPGIVDPAPGRPNIRDIEAVDEAVVSLLEEIGPFKRNEAALILPDESSRLTVLDFDALPSNREERDKLLRFRLAKSVPFDVQEARLAAAISKNGKGVSALVAVTASEVVRQYESVLENAGLWPGHVSISTADALNLVEEAGMTLFAKLSSRMLTLVAVDGDQVRMVRAVERAPETLRRSRPLARRHARRPLSHARLRRRQSRRPSGTAWRSAASEICCPTPSNAFQPSSTAPSTPSARRTAPPAPASAASGGISISNDGRRTKHACLGDAAPRHVHLERRPPCRSPSRHPWLSGGHGVLCRRPLF